VKTVIRLALGATVLAAAMFASVAPTMAAQTHNTIIVTCSDGYSRTVSAKAAHGVARALTQFSAHNKNGVTCSAAPGAPRVAAVSWVTVSCTNGFEKRVNAKAATPIVEALNAYSTRKNLGVTCSVV